MSRGDRRDNKWADDYDEDDYDDYDDFTPEPSMSVANSAVYAEPEEPTPGAFQVKIESKQQPNKERQREAEQRAAAEKAKRRQEIISARAVLEKEGFNVEKLNDEGVLALFENKSLGEREFNEVSTSPKMVSTVHFSKDLRVARLQSPGELFFAITMPLNYPSSLPEIDMSSGHVSDFVFGALAQTAKDPNFRQDSRLFTKLVQLCQWIVENELNLPNDLFELQVTLQEIWEKISGFRVTLLRQQKGALVVKVKAPLIIKKTVTAHGKQGHHDPSTELEYAYKPSKRPVAKPAPTVVGPKFAVPAAESSIDDNDAALLDKMATALEREYDTLAFSHRTLTKPIPASLGQLAPFLTVLNLVGCNITTLPKVNSLALRKCYLSRNQLKKVPMCLLSASMQKTLQVLDLSSNLLTELPQELTMMEHLRILSCEWNKIKSLCSFDKMKKLEVLELTDNELTGIPPEVGLLDNLWRLKLSSNPMYQIPPEVYHRGIQAVKRFLLELSPGSLPVPPSTLASDVAELHNNIASPSISIVHQCKTHTAAAKEAEGRPCSLQTFKFIVEARAPGLLHLASAYDTENNEDGSVCVRIILDDDCNQQAMEAFFKLVTTAHAPKLVKKDLDALQLLVVKYGSDQLQRELHRLVKDVLFSRDEAMGVSFATLLPNLVENAQTTSLTAEDDGNDSPATAVAKPDAIFDEHRDPEVISFSVGPTQTLFSAHRALICVRCPYFKSMLESGLAESQMSVIPLPEVEPAIFEALLTFLYTDSHGKKMTPSNVVDLLFLAAKFDVGRLRAMAECMVGFNVEVDNVAQVIQLAYFLDSERLKRACMFYTAIHFQAVKQTDGYKELQDEVKDELHTMMEEWKHEQNGK